MKETQGFFDTEDSEQSDAKVSIAHLMGKQNIELKTDIKEHEVMALSILELLAFRYDLKGLNKWVDFMKINRVSEDRKSRAEVVEISKGQGQNQENNKMELLKQKLMLT